MRLISLAVVCAAATRAVEEADASQTRCDLGLSLRCAPPALCETADRCFGAAGVGDVWVVVGYQQPSSCERSRSIRDDDDDGDGDQRPLQSPALDDFRGYDDIVHRLSVGRTAVSDWSACYDPAHCDARGLQYANELTADWSGKLGSQSHFCRILTYRFVAIAAPA